MSGSKGIAKEGTRTLSGRRSKRGYERWPLDSSWGFKAFTN